MIQFEDNIFQLTWNDQLEYYSIWPDDLTADLCCAFWFLELYCQVLGGYHDQLWLLQVCMLQGHGITTPRETNERNIKT